MGQPLKVLHANGSLKSQNTATVRMSFYILFFALNSHERLEKALICISNWLVRQTKSSHVDVLLSQALDLLLLNIRNGKTVVVLKAFPHRSLQE